MMFILSSPSGAGKTTLTKKIAEENSNFKISISHTTRTPRPNEENGKDYYFVSNEKFNDLIKKESFFEHAKIFENLYGTLKKPVIIFINEGKDVLFDIDWQGTEQIKKKNLNYKLISFFILPPSKTELFNRSIGETTDIVNKELELNYRNTTKKIEKLVAFKEKLSDNISAISKANNAINSAKSHLNNAKNILNNILGSSSESDRDSAATSFDGQLSDINTKVNNANQNIGFRNINLIGQTTGPEWKTDDIYLPSSEKGNSIMEVKGTFLGVDFLIIDSDGFHWRLDKFDKTFYQYTTDGMIKRTGQSIPTEGLLIENHDPISGSITYGGSASLSGTLIRGGLEILTSEYYNNFADDASVKSAISDIDEALNQINVKGSHITNNAALLEGRINIIDSKISTLKSEKKQIISEEVDSSNAISKAADTKLRLAVLNIDLLSQASNGLIENMLSLSKGPQKVGGLFGLMGY